MYRSYANKVVDSFSGYANIEAFNHGETVMAHKKELSFTHEWLLDNLDFDIATGIFSWKKPGYGRTVGKPIGDKPRADGTNYLMMRINGQLLYAHRLAWFYVSGEWPDGVIDHIDGNKTNNAISNLRAATHAQNAARRKTTRMIGPSRGVVPHQGGYVARIHHAGKRHYLGYFLDPEEAKAAYEAKAKELHGEFAHAPEPARDRGDWMSATKCEACGGTEGLRLDRTRIGTPRGKLCLECWGMVLTHSADAKKIHKRASQIISYINTLDVKEEVPEGVGLIEYLAEHRPDILAEINRNTKT